MRHETKNIVRSGNIGNRGYVFGIFDRKVVEYVDVFRKFDFQFGAHAVFAQMVGIDPVGSVLIGHSGRNIIIDPVAPSRHFRKMLVERLGVIINQPIPVGWLSRDVGKVHIVHITERLRRVLFIGFQIFGHLRQGSEFPAGPADISLLQDVDIFFAVHQNPGRLERLAESETARIAELRLVALSFLRRYQYDPV